MIIYKITNLINKKVYIGKDKNNNKKYLGSGIYLKRSIKKYGRNNFKKEILEYCYNDIKINNREKYWIKFYKSNNNKYGYNLTDGGDGGYTSRFSKNRKNNIKKMHKGAEKYRKSEKFKKISKELFPKLWENKEFKKKMLKILSVKKGILWRKRISEGLKEYYKINPKPPLSDATREKMSKKLSGRELVKVNKKIQNKILKLYYRMGVTSIKKELLKINIKYSCRLIERVLRKFKVYPRYKKGNGLRLCT